MYNSPFDKVPHQRPLLKLEQIGIRGNFLGCIKCSLTKPSQKWYLRVFHQRKCSFHKEYHRGQSLLLSLLFVDVIETNIDSQMHLLQTIVFYTEL